MVIIDGFRASACTIVLGAVPDDKICVTSRAKFGFHAPWIVERPNEDAFIVKDAKGLAVATIRCRDDILRSSFGHNRLTSDEGVQGVPELKVKQALKGHKDRSVRRVRGRQRGRGNSRSCRSKGEPATSGTRVVQADGPVSCEPT
jgi:hypothetical protein